MGFFDTTLGFVGIWVKDGEEKGGCQKLKLVKGEEAIKKLQEIKANGNHCWVKIQVFDGIEYMTIDCEHLSTVSLDKKGPYIHFLSPCRFQPFTVIGWGLLEEREIAVDHFTFEGETFSSFNMAKALQREGKYPGVVGKNGEVINGNEIRNMVFPYQVDEWNDKYHYSFKKWVDVQYFITYNGIKYNMV